MGRGEGRVSCEDGHWLGGWTCDVCPDKRVELRSFGRDCMYVQLWKSFSYGVFLRQLPRGSSSFMMKERMTFGLLWFPVLSDNYRCGISRSEDEV